MELAQDRAYWVCFGVKDMESSISSLNSAALVQMRLLHLSLCPVMIYSRSELSELRYRVVFYAGTKVSRRIFRPSR
jgi:hypothetical protein